MLTAESISLEIDEKNWLNFITNSPMHSKNEKHLIDFKETQKL